MTKEELMQELKNKDTLYPQELLQDTDPMSIATVLIDIFDSNKQELEDNEKLKSNYTELVNYVYLNTLSKKSENRNKEIFSNQLTTFLLNPPQAV